MNHRFGSIRVLAAALGAPLLVSLVGAGTGCSGGAGTSDREQTGEISFALMTVPSDVQCIILTAQGSTRTVTRSFDVMPGASSILEDVTGVPLGAVTFSASAYNRDCIGVSPMLSADWVSDPVLASVLFGVVNQVTLEMHRNGQVAVGVDFPNDPACTANGGVCVQSAECCSAICSGGVCAASAMCGADGTMCATSASCCSGNCTNGVCSAGMNMCAPNGAACMTSASCCSGFCTGGACSATANTCMDGMQDGSETDTDCGGGTCVSCAVGKKCLVATDCVTGDCKGGVCVSNGGCTTNMDCTNPPAGSCMSVTGGGGVATVFQNPGACMGGMCTYPSTALMCPKGCAGSVCATM
jgi:hypothetical protein